MKDEVLLIDADIVAYRCGFACEKKHFVVETPDGREHLFETHKEAVAYVRAHPEVELSVEHKLVVEPVQNALHNVSTTLAGIRSAYPTAEVRIFLSGKRNPRYGLATIKPYKGNRSAFAKPRWYNEIRDYLVRLGATVVDGAEADDELGIQQYELAKAGKSPIIVSTDKDLNMIEGRHYNWVNKEEYSVDEDEAYRSFFGQLLTGDRVDNVPGIDGVGPVRASEILADYRRPRAMLTAVRRAYRDAYPNGITRSDGSVLGTDKAIIEIGQLLWIKRAKDEPLWHPNQVK